MYLRHGSDVPMVPTFVAYKADKMVLPMVQLYILTIF